MRFFEFVIIITMKIIQSKNKIISVLMIVVLMVVFGAGLFYVVTKSELLSDKTPNTNDISEVKKDIDTGPQKYSVKFAAMGDMLAHDTIIANAKVGDDYDFAKYFSNIRKSYSDADVVFCNQEGLSSGADYIISGYPSFNAPKKYSTDLQSGAGCNLINLANNHIGDKGTNAINATIDNWNSLKPLGVSGANKSVEEQNKVNVVTVNNIKIGYLSFADFNNNGNTPAYAVNIYHDQELVKRLVSEAKSKSDVVVVSMHWGMEDSNIVNFDQQKQVELLGSLGVDVIIGTGPHVLQKFETIDRADGGKMYVWYSLGNMLSSQLNINQLIGGIAKFEITKIEDKVSIDGFEFIPTYMHYEWTQSEASSYNLLARKNAMIYLLDQSAEPLSRSLFSTDVDDQKQYVVNTIGTEVKVVDL